MTTAIAWVSSLWSRLVDKGPFEWIIWSVALVSWAYLLLITEGQLLQITVWSVPFVLMTVGLLWPWRSVSLKTVTGFFMLGMGPVLLLALLTQALLDGSFIEDWVETALDGLAASGWNLNLNFLDRDLWAPISEELFKVAPLLAFLWWRQSGLRVLAGPIDYAILAGATGAGMAFGEDILSYFSFGLNGPPSSAFALGLGRVYEALVGFDGAHFSFTGRSTFADLGSFIYPEMFELSGVVWSGHGALAFGLGLAIGLGIHLARRHRRPFAYLLPVVVFLWVTWEHMMGNWHVGATGCESTTPGPLCILTAVDLHGRMFPIVLLAGLGYTIYLSRSVLRSFLKADPELGYSGADTAHDSYAEMGWRGPMMMMRDRFDFARWRRKTALGAFHLEHARKIRRYHVLAVSGARLRALIIKQRLVGQPTTTLPKGAESVLGQVSAIS